MAKREKREAERVIEKERDKRETKMRQAREKRETEREKNTEIPKIPIANLSHDLLIYIALIHFLHTSG